MNGFSHVYMIWSLDGRLLYIGAGYVTNRLAAHEKAWLHEPYHCDVIAVPGPNINALALERDLIWSLQPERNIDWKDGTSKFWRNRIPVAVPVDAGHAAPRLLARVAFLLVLTALASLMAWNAPAGTPLALLLAAGAWYVMVRLLGAGALATGRHQRAGGGQ